MKTFLLLALLPVAALADAPVPAPTDLKSFTVLEHHIGIGSERVVAGFTVTVRALLHRETNEFVYGHLRFNCKTKEVTIVDSFNLSEDLKTMTEDKRIEGQTFGVDHSMAIAALYELPNVCGNGRVGGNPVR